MKGDIIGHATLAGQGELKPEWIWAMESPNLIHSVDKNNPAAAQSSQWSSRTQQLVEQLGVMDNRLLSRHTEVRSKLISLIDCFETVFTDGEVSVGKTDELKMRIVLDSSIKPIRAPVRKIKPALQESLCKQIDS